MPPPRAHRHRYYDGVLAPNDRQWGYNGFPFVYSDNTTVSQNQNQQAAFVAARYIYKF